LIVYKYIDIIESTRVKNGLFKKEGKIDKADNKTASLLFECIKRKLAGKGRVD